MKGNRLSFNPSKTEDALQTQVRGTGVFGSVRDVLRPNFRVVQRYE